MRTALWVLSGCDAAVIGVIGVYVGLCVAAVARPC